MTKIVYTPVWSQKLELGDVAQMLSSQYALAGNGECIEGIQLPSTHLIVAKRLHDQGNVATYAALSDELEKTYPGGLFTASLTPGTLFDVSLSSNKSGLYVFTIADLSIPDGNAIVLEISVKNVGGHKAYETALETVQKGETQEEPNARTAETDTRLLRRLRQFLEG